MEIMEFLRSNSIAITENTIAFLKSNSVEMKGFIFLFGLCVGSFLNVCIVRWPKNESVSKGRSRCPACKSQLAWFENIPLASFVFLRGKCRHCKAGISFRYPLVELLTAVAFLLLYLYLGATVQFVFFAYFVASLMIATFADFERQIIPDEVSLTGILLGLTASFFYPILHGEMSRRLGLADSAGGMLAGIWLIWGTAMLGRALFRKEAMGGGDLKLLAMIGAFIGFEKTLLTFFIAPVVALPVALVVKLKAGKIPGKASRESVEGSGEDIPEGAIAFGPYLAMASLIALFYGDWILDWIVGM